MIKEERLLDMSDVGLGNLTEYRLLVLLGNYHSLCLVEGLDIMPDQIVDSSEKLLYPAYFTTHLKIPVTNLIENYTLWENIQVEVDVKRFGSNILDSAYSFNKKASKEELKESIEMTSNSLFVVDATIDKSVERTSSVPKSNCIAALEKSKVVPKALKLFKNIRNNGMLLEFEHIVECPSFEYKIVSNRDASNNHGVIFAKYIEIMDICEQEFLCSSGCLGLPLSIISCIHTIDRQTFYYSNCFADEVIEVKLKLAFEKCEERNLTGEKSELTPYRIIETHELFNKHTHNLVAIAKTTKIVCLSPKYTDLESDINRLVIKQRK